MDAFINASQTSSYPLCLESPCPVILTNLMHELDTRFFEPTLILSWHILMPPIRCSPNERRDQSRAKVCHKNRLSQREDEGHIAMDAEVSLEDLASAETFPRPCYLDEDPCFEHASFFVHGDYFPRAMVTVYSLSNLDMASISVNTLPGTWFRISHPMVMRRRRRAYLACSSRLLDFLTA